ncbi:DUF3080 family protein [Oceanisphaera pacifica]|nr:DUF3080 family protein [Oceanisphaera pacifica]
MACSPNNDLESHFQTYLTRLAHVLKVDAPSLTPVPTLPDLPSQRLLVAHQEQISSGVLDALQLGQCEGLFELVAEHNGPVGKSQSAAGQLLYHLQFQYGLHACQTEHSDPKLQAWLANISQQKQPLLPRFFWNMMIAEPELRAALAPRRQTLPFEQQAGYHSTLHALSLFNDLYQQAQGNRPLQPISNELLSEALAGLYQNHYLGRLFYSLHSGAHYLEQSIQFLQQLKQLDCRRAERTDAKRLRNAMQHYYIKDIQRYLGQIDRQFVQLAPLLSTSLTPPEEKDALMHAYRQQVAQGLNSQVYVRYRHLTLKHAKVWQQFLKRCELSPL